MAYATSNDWKLRVKKIARVLPAFLTCLLLSSLRSAAAGTDVWTKVVGNSVVPLGDGFGAGGVLNTNNTIIQSLNAYNGFLYAAVETVSNQPTIWRSSDLINWTNVVSNFHVNMRNVFDMQSNTNGIFFGTGYGMSPFGAQVWKSTDGVSWFTFSDPANGFFETNSQVMVSLQGSRLYASIMSPTTNGCAEVWERPANGLSNWTKVLDFNTGLGSADGVLTNVGYSYLYAPPGATNAVFLPCNNSAITNCWIYETVDGGATWHKNTGAGTGFGDNYNAYITCIIEFNGYLYVGTGNPAEGAQMWRTPLTNAVNWSSTNAWQMVASGGLVNKSNGEFHRFSVGCGKLWMYLAANGPEAQVWCSDDGTNWVQSNADGFGIADHSSVGSLAAFTGTNGNIMVCGSEWINATNSRITAAQVWAAQITTSIPPVIVTVSPLPGGQLGAGYSQTLAAGGGTPAYTWSLIGGALPDGLTLSTAGQISGTPAAVGTFTFTVQITDAVGQIAMGALNIVVTDPWVQFVGNSIVPLGDGFGAGGVMNANNTGIYTMNAYNGFIYAGVQTISNSAAVWRSSDLINWTNVLGSLPPFIIEMQSNTNGIFFGAGGGQAWKSIDGLNWSQFSSGHGYIPAGNYSAEISLQGIMLYMATANTNGSQVWRRPADGSANWTKLLDFNTGFGSADGPHTNYSELFIYCPPGATNAVFLSVADSSMNGFLYETADGGTTWHQNAAVGNGFGDTNIQYIAAMVEFNGCLYAGTGNNAGGQIWRTPLTNAANWSSANAWQRVVVDGFGHPNTEFHRFAVAYGKLWTFFAAHGGLKEEVWRTGDGTNWVQSNVSGFGTSEYANPGALASFTGADGTNYMVWGGVWTSPTNSNINAAQIWAMQIFPPTGYAAWSASITNGLTNLTDSATHDGYPNLLKYATGSNPTNSDTLAKMTGMQTTNGIFALIFNRNTNANDITLIAEGSYGVTNNSPWNGIATNIGGTGWNSTNVVEAGTGTPVSVSVTDNAPPATNRFLRLRVTKP